MTIAVPQNIKFAPLTLNSLLDVNMELLEKFNERVNRLENSKFVEWTYTPRQQPQDNTALAKDWLALRGLHKDEFDGFILNFRFLIQDRDGFSVRCVKEFYEKLPPIFDTEKTQFSEIYKNFKGYLSERSFIQVGSKTLSNQDLRVSRILCKRGFSTAAASGLRTG